VSEAAVVDASPLIYLAHANLIDLLRVAGPLILVPTTVSQEIRRRGENDPTVQALENTPWLREVEPGPDSPRVVPWALGPGETSVLSWTLAHPGSLAVLDDLAGRRCAEVLEIPLIGTLGLVLRAKTRGDLPAARPVVERLREAGMYLSDSVLSRALALVGE
jgi:predicted nucleic acid-binding protein